MSVVTEDRLQGFKENFNLPALPPTSGVWHYIAPRLINSELGSPALPLQPSRELAV